MLLAAELRLYVSTNTCGHFFFNTAPLFAIGIISEGESSKVKQQWKICHKFQCWIMQDLPYLTKCCTQQAQIGTWKSSKRDLVLHLQAALFNSFRNWSDKIRMAEITWKKGNFWTHQPTSATARLRVSPTSRRRNANLACSLRFSSCS